MMIKKKNEDEDESLKILKIAFQLVYFRLSVVASKYSMMFFIKDQIFLQLKYARYASKCESINCN